MIIETPLNSVYLTLCLSIVDELNFMGCMKTILNNYKTQTHEFKKIDDIEPRQLDPREVRGGTSCWLL
jgi:hypothetical protein